MHKEKLGFQHKELLLEKLSQINTSISEFSFSNLYLFRDKHEYQVVTHEDCIYIQGQTYDGFFYAMPLKDLREATCDKIYHILDDVDFLFPIDETWLPFLQKHDLSISYAEGDMDYMYTVKKISTYKGSRELHKKRNLLKQYITLHEHQEYPLVQERMPDALSILKQWQSETAEEEDETDYFACKEALEKYEELVLCGAIFYAEGEPAGFIIGEELTPETFAIHFAKAKRKFKGIYQFMFNTFAKILPQQYKYLNFEQDLGKRTLRIAKASYVPDIMLKKYRVRLRRN